MNYGQTIAAAVDEVLHRKMRTVQGPLTVVFVSVNLPFQTSPSREELESRTRSKDALLRRHAELMLQILDRNGKLPDHHSYPIEVWQFGKDLTFIALGGEVVVDYSLRFKRQYGFDQLWVAGYMNDVFAYIPSRRVLEGRRLRRRRRDDSVRPAGAVHAGRRRDHRAGRYFVGGARTAELILNFSAASRRFGVPVATFGRTLISQCLG